MRRLTSVEWWAGHWQGAREGFQFKLSTVLRGPWLCPWTYLKFDSLLFKESMSKDSAEPTGKERWPVVVMLTEQFRIVWDDTHFHKIIIKSSSTKGRFGPEDLEVISVLSTGVLSSADIKWPRPSLITVSWGHSWEKEASSEDYRGFDLMNMLYQISTPKDCWVAHEP